MRVVALVISAVVLLRADGGERREKGCERADSESALRRAAMAEARAEKKQKQDESEQQWQERRAMVVTDGTTLYDFQLNKCGGERPNSLGCRHCACWLL